MMNPTGHVPPLRLPRRRWLCVLAGAALLLAAVRARGADGPSVESRVKSAFVFNFIQFIDWPDGSFARTDDPIVIGLIDPDPLEGALTAVIDGKTAKGRKIEIRHIAPGGAASGCQIVVIGSTNAAQAPDLIKSLAHTGVLTIGDSEDFIDAGGIIRFYLEDRKERFEINLTAAERAHLQISSKLLKLAKVVNR